MSDVHSDEYIELTDKMYEIADSVKIPDGIGGIKDVR